MRISLILLLFTTLASPSEASDWQLTDGTVYHNVIVTSHDINRVTITADEGTVTIDRPSLSATAEEELQKIETGKAPADTAIAARQEKAKHQAELAKAVGYASTAYQKVTAKSPLSGQIFIVTKGGDNVKLGDVKVRLYTIFEVATLMEESANHGDDAMLAEMPQPLEEATSDADGKFTIQVPTAGDGTTYQIFAYASRSVGDDTEKYHWFVGIPKDVAKPLFLSNDNLSY